MYKKEYYLIFSSSKHRHGFLLKKRYQHIKLLHKDDFNWTLIDPNTSCLDFTIIPYDVCYPVWKIYKDKGCRVVKIVMGNPREKFKIFSIRAASCVLVVQYIIGLKFRVLTPYGLFKKLCRLKNLHRYDILNIKIM